jgi:hypothetical protein
VFSFLVLRSKVFGDTVSPEARIKLEAHIDVLRKRIVGLMRVFVTYFQVITVR